jgi:hypothetical protein
MRTVRPATTVVINTRTTPSSTVSASIGVAACNQSSDRYIDNTSKKTFFDNDEETCRAHFRIELGTVLSLGHACTHQIANHGRATVRGRFPIMPEHAPR